MPCGVSITGPTVPLSPFSPDGHPHLLYGPTAVISATAYPVFSYGTCSAAASLEYLEVNTNRPSNGGQVVYATNSGGVNNLTISFNYFHGNNWQADSGVPYGSGAQSSIMVLFDGGGTADTGDTVSWNRFGANGDCSGVVSNMTYSGFPTSGGTGDGGFCTAVAWHGDMTNFTVSNNFIYYQEQGIKGFEGAGSGPNYTCANCLIQYNDISNWHRMGIETQMQGVVSTPATPQSTMTFQYNSMHDPLNPGNGTFGISSNNGCPCTNSNPTTGDSISNDISNVLIDNVPVASGSNPGFNGDGIEFWSQNRSSVGNNNLIQGQWSNSFIVGVDGAMTASNNHIQSSYGWGGSNTPANCNPYTPGGYGWWNQERSPPNTPSGSGNQCDFFDGSAQTSAAATVSPASGSFSGSQVVTFTDAGNTSGAGPQGNTGIWYTTDGSTPVPGSGTTKYISTGGTITLTTTTTVKAVGMWGAANQPANYPTGPISGTFGYVPSAVISATYTGAGAATLSSIAVSGTSSLQVGGATSQLTATGTYSNSTTGTVTPSSWVSSTPAVATISASGVVTPVSAGTTSITATSGSVTSSGYTITVTAAAPFQAPICPQY